jgi:hypothetical protein
MDINKLNQSTIGFAYSGNDFLTRTRIYLIPLDKDLNPNTRLLNLCPLRKKMGKRLKLGQGRANQDC